MTWRHRHRDGVRYLPSSSLKADILVARRWLDTDREFEWLRRLCWVIDAALVQMEDITDVVLDLPPGLWGFAHQALVLGAALSTRGDLPANYPSWTKRIAWNVAGWLVSSPDTNDLVMAVEYRGEVLPKFPELRLAVNRRTESETAIQARLARVFGPAMRALLRDTPLNLFDDDEFVRRLFRVGDVDLSTVGPSFAQLLSSQGGENALASVLTSND
jgi:hypothetical protein